MPVKHINPKAKEESGVILSGEDAIKVFSLFFNDKKEKVELRKRKFRQILLNALNR